MDIVVSEWVVVAAAAEFERDTADRHVELVRVTYHSDASVAVEAVQQVVCCCRAHCRNDRPEDHEYDEGEWTHPWNLRWCSNCPSMLHWPKDRNAVERLRVVVDEFDVSTVAGEEELNRFDRMSPVGVAVAEHCQHWRWSTYLQPMRMELSMLNDRSHALDDRVYCLDHSRRSESCHSTSVGTLYCVYFARDCRRYLCDWISSVFSCSRSWLTHCGAQPVCVDDRDFACVPMTMTRLPMVAGIGVAIDRRAWYYWWRWIFDFDVRSIDFYDRALDFERSCSMDCWEVGGCRRCVAVANGSLTPRMENWEDDYRDDRMIGYEKAKIERIKLIARRRRTLPSIQCRRQKHLIVQFGRMIVWIRWRDSPLIMN